MHSYIYGNFYVMRVSVWVGGRKGTFNWEFTLVKLKFPDSQYSKGIIEYSSTPIPSGYMVLTYIV
jgi:hypothetical protein